MNLNHTITFEEVVTPEVRDPEGNVILEGNSFESYVLRIYDLDNPIEDGAPQIYQPTNHNTGEPFASEEDAEAWYQWWIEIAYPPVIEESPAE
jgi:hypothetical protein